MPSPGGRSPRACQACILCNNRFKKPVPLLRAPGRAAGILNTYWNMRRASGEAVELPDCDWGASLNFRGRFEGNTVRLQGGVEVGVGGWWLGAWVGGHGGHGACGQLDAAGLQTPPSPPRHAAEGQRAAGHCDRQQNLLLPERSACCLPRKACLRSLHRFGEPLPLQCSKMNWQVASLPAGAPSNLFYAQRAERARRSARRVLKRRVAPVLHRT